MCPVWPFLSQLFLDLHLPAYRGSSGAVDDACAFKLTHLRTVVRCQGPIMPGHNHAAELAIPYIAHIAWHLPTWWNAVNNNCPKFLLLVSTPVKRRASARGAAQEGAIYPCVPPHKTWRSNLARAQSSLFGWKNRCAECVEYRHYEQLKRG